MAAAIKKAGLKHITAHYLRHTGAGIHLMAGIPRRLAPAVIRKVRKR